MKIYRIWLVFLTTSCIVPFQKAATNKGADGVNQASETLGYIDNDDGSKWPSSRIEVCWLRSDNMPSFPAAESAIKKHITERFIPANVDFVGWGDCPNEMGQQVKPIKWGTHSGIDSVVGISGGFGYKSNSHQKPVELSTQGNSKWCPGQNYLESNCLLNVALHEFGHVAGLHHEMNRADIAPSEEKNFCHDQMNGLGEKDAVNLGEPDKLSVMNYCHVYWNNSNSKLIKLSFFDILTIYTIFHGVYARLELPYSGDQAFILPKTISKNKFPISIYGNGLTSFQFLWTDAKSSCSDTNKRYSSWSPWRPISQGIQEKDIPFKNKKILLYHPLKLCVVGKSNTKTQPKYLPTSIVFEIDNGETTLPRP